MSGILLSAGIILIFLICVRLLDSRDALKCGVISVFSFFCLYVTVSGILFGLDMFSMEKALALITVSEGIILTGIRRRKVQKQGFDVREYFFPVILVICMLPFVWNKFGFYGMGQDEGVYQTQAIAFMNGNYGNQKELSEYETLDEAGREDYRQFVDSKLVGFYVYDASLPSLPEEERLSGVSGFYHGIPTFSAVLALWGKIFGMKHMADIQTVFFVCGIFLLYFTCGNLRFHKYVKYAVTLLYTCSPILIWTAKSSLTEIFLTCIMAGFLYFITGSGSGAEIGYACLTIVTFSFYHLTIYTVIPVFLLVFWGMFLHTGKKGYIHAAIVSLVTFGISMIGIAKIAATYSYVYNFWPLYRIAGFINQKTVVPVLVSASCLGIIVSVLVLAFGNRAARLIPRLGMAGKFCVRLFIASFFVIQVYRISRFTENGYGTIWEALRNSTFSGFAIYGGGVLFFLVFAYVFCRPAVCRKNAQTAVLSGMFAYCVMFYAGFLRTDILYHYYYGRYLAPFICVAVLVAGIMLNEWNTMPGRWGMWILTAGYAAVCLRYDLVLAGNNDDTRMSWEIMEDVAGVISENDVVYMDYDLGMLLYLPIREMANVPVYPVRTHELMEKAFLTETGGGNIYFISELYQYLPECDIVYGNWYETSEDQNRYRGGILPLPRQMEKENRSIAVYRILKAKERYCLADKDIMLGGYYSLESNFRWTDPQKNTLRCILHKSDYTVRIEQGSLLPLAGLGREEYEVNLMVNDRFADSYVITEDNIGSDLVFKVSGEMLEEGINHISLISEPWSPQEFGSPDSRILGIAVGQILFEIE